MKKILLLISSLLFLFACSEERLQTHHKIDKEKRTLLFYLAGDNNLSFEVKRSRENLRKAWDAETMGKLIMLSDDNIDGMPILETLTTRKGQNTWDTLKVYKNPNSACPCVLKRAIVDMQAYAPAKHYGFITFSHATGWLPAGAFANPTGWKPSSRSLSRSVFVDGKREMELADFATAIPDNVFDFIAFDMCFMAGIEVAYALRNKTKYIVASAAEVLSPGFLPIYPEHLSKLYASTPDLTGFASAFFDYFDKQKGVYRSATISVIDTRQIEGLVALTRELASNLTQVQTNQLQYYDRNGTPHLFFDFADYLHLAAQTPPLHAHIDELLARSVIFKRHTHRLINIDITHHSGLSVYVPQTILPNLNRAYENTEWSKIVR